MKLGRTAIGAVLGLAMAPCAWGSAPDTFGLGGRWQGAGGGGVAVVSDGTAAMLNPAGLSRIRRPTAGLGIQGAFPQFRAVPDLYWDTNRDGVIDESDPPLEHSVDPDSVVAGQLHMGRHVGGKFGLGLVAHVPLDTLVRFKTFEPELPTYPMWDNRLERFALAAGIGGQLFEGFNVGVGVDALAAARLTVALTADVGVSGADTSGSELDTLVTDAVIDLHEINFRIVPAFAPTAGIQWELGPLVPALDGLVLGLAYHGEVGLPIDLDLDLQANVDIQDVGELNPYVTSVIAEAQLMLFDHYVPRRISQGIAYQRGDTFTLYGDVRWTQWSRMRLNVAQLVEASLTSPLIDVSDVIRDGNAYEVLWRDTVGARIGVDMQLPEWSVSGNLRYVRLRLRGGFGTEPSALLGQRTDSKLLDAARTTFTLGAGAEVWDPFALVDGPVRLDLYGQFHNLQIGSLERATDVPQAGFPIGTSTLPIGGTVVVLGGEWSFEY